MKKITFRYKDAFSRGEWRTQSCVTTSVAECIKFYGLDNGDCEYEIISVEDVD